MNCSVLLGYQLHNHLLNRVLQPWQKRYTPYNKALCKWGHFEKAKTTFKMLLATWFLVWFFKRFRSIVAENLGSVGQRAAKLPAIKLWEWFDRAGHRTQADWFEWGRGRLADFFLRPPTLTASNLAALWPTNPKFLALKDLILLKKHTKIQVASSILKVVFAFSNWPHLHWAYVMSGCIFFATAVRRTSMKLFLAYKYPLPKNLSHTGIFVL